MIAQPPSPDRFSNLLKTAVPAVIMPMLLAGAPAWFTGNETLLHLAWSVIAPSSLAGALAAVYLPPLRALLIAMQRRLPKIIVALLAAILVMGLAAILGALAGVIGLIAPTLWFDIGTSAGIGAFASVLTVFPAHPGKTPHSS